jgi:retinol dehydrogenase-12
MPPSPAFSTAWTHFFPPKPTFTDHDVPDLAGKVCLVTGANTGMGKTLAHMLYAKNAKVYLACRAPEKATQAIDDIRKSVPTSSGSLVFLHLDLADLSKTKEAAETFLSKENTLHVLFNNAGVTSPDVSPPAKSAQGYELAMGVNCVATYLFTRLLTPVLVSTARAEPNAGVRVVWVSSWGLEQYAIENVGVPVEMTAYEKASDQLFDRYGLSKVGSWALAVECGRRLAGDGVLSVPLNPGNLRTELGRDLTKWIAWIVYWICYPIIRGVYTQLYAAFSPDLANGKFDICKQWGKSQVCFLP